ncbi:MAG: toxin-antitoxin system YwqK family antitoxin [Fibrobacter sp.]|uniref:toxin-antitoxin system YwqK family antitoxin n=1 Tax=Fibrobacter sp. TaxID=35828 RepID=UPI00388EDA9F|nr:toxin-antitoxin system YwqK family antitoxin [Fibrobacter sp.]
MKRFFLGILALDVMLATQVMGGEASQLGSRTDSPVVLDTVRTFFENGSPARVYTVQHGTDIREGVSFTYHPNGLVAIEAPYKNGKLDGVFRSHYENGKLWQTIGYRDGVEEGISTDYFENGVKHTKEVYKNGVLDGLSEEWFESGVIRRKMPYSGGQVHGKAQIFDELGAVKEEMEFERGLRQGAYRRYNKGVKVLEAKFERNRCVENCDF